MQALISVEVAIARLEHAVLEWLIENKGYGWGYCWNLTPICEGTGLDRDTVRWVLGRLRERDWVEYHRGLWTDDGEPAGAGYCVSDRGRRILVEFVKEAEHGCA